MSELQDTKDRLPDEQEVAYTFYGHLMAARSDRKAAKIFTRTLAPEGRSQRQIKKAALAYLRQTQAESSQEAPPFSPSEVELLTDIRSELAATDQAQLDEKKGSFSKLDRTRIMLKLNSGHALTESERRGAYLEAGYTKDQIAKVTGKKFLVTNILGNATWAMSDFVLKPIFTTHPDIIPHLNSIAHDPKIASAAIIASLATDGLTIEQDLRLTKTIGMSESNVITGAYMAGETLFENRRTPGRLARLCAYTNTVLFGGGYAALTQLSGNTEDLVSGSMAVAGFNIALAGGLEGWKRIAEKKQRKREQAIQDPSLA